MHTSLIGRKKVFFEKERNLSKQKCQDKPFHLSLLENEEISFALARKLYIVCAVSLKSIRYHILGTKLSLWKTNCTA